METGFHPLTELFAQLGLPNQPDQINTFVEAHKGWTQPLPEAPFWSASQARFLAEALTEDADWAEAVDHLAALLR
ncbi:DUF2789 domain-containing protein [Halothiobacillus sp. DCM-1]|uniref:DUF2789 domain-containing protein n=1 Tax=Halothiobacillus sp. DCM-1 TaxID=3112558 RepID=UPI0032432D41